MKGRPFSKTTPGGEARVEFRFSAKRPAVRPVGGAYDPEGSRGAGRATPSNLPKATQRLVVGYFFERLIQEGKVKDYAEIARLTGLTRARVTQLVDLTLLDPRDQRALLLGPTPHNVRRSSLFSPRAVGTEGAP